MVVNVSWKNYIKMLRVLNAVQKINKDIKESLHVDFTSSKTVIPPMNPFTGEKWKLPKKEAPPFVDFSDDTYSECTEGCINDFARGGVVRNSKNDITFLCQVEVFENEG